MKDLKFVFSLLVFLLISPIALFLIWLAGVIRWISDKFNLVVFAVID